MIHGFDDSTKEKVQISDIFLVERKSVSIGDIPANSWKGGRLDISRDGYKAIGLAGWSIGWNDVGDYIIPNGARIDVDEQVAIAELYNTQSQAVYGMTMTVWVTYVKDE